MKKRSLLLGLVFLLFLALPAYANIIDSTYGAGAGSFELGVFVNNGSDYMVLAPGATTITGWTIGGPGDGVDWLTTPTFRADTGIHAVDLQHLTGSSIATVIPTVDGYIYNLTFGAAAWSTYPARTGIVSAGSLVNQPFTAVDSSSPSVQTFTPFAFLFTATGPTTTIQFTGTGPNSTYGPAIDSVSVELAVPVPLPPTVLLLGSGLLGLAGWRRLRKS